jgi:formylglycine-generating enzyme required for sulfatase activity
MARVGNSCIDRWEVHTVDAKTKLPLSPFYPPEPLLLRKVYTFWSTEASRTGSERARQLALPPVPEHQKAHFEPRAMSAPGVLPQGYMTYYSAKKSCENAGKRLCSEEEWVRACRGKRGTKHPYGENFLVGKCNIFRQIHPAYELHGNSSLGHLDPRLHLVVEGLDQPLLMETGQLSQCVSEVREGTVFDLEGNLDEWIDDEKGVFVGGFFSRQTKEGCEAKIEGHAPVYTDYSLGTRCCKALE